MADRYLSAKRLAALVGNKFGHPCPVHLDIPCVYFCIDCQELPQEALCFACRGDHPSHRMLQVRKASLYEVVRVQDIVGVIDITGIQEYVRNKFKVVHLSRWGTCRGSVVRSMTRRGRRRPQRFECISCKRNLMGVAKYCSIGCKVEAEARNLPDNTGRIKGTIKYRDVDDLYRAVRAIKKQKVLVEHRSSLKTENSRLSRPLRAHDDATPPICSLNTEAASPKSPRKGRPVRAPFY